MVENITTIEFQFIQQCLKARLYDLDDNKLISFCNSDFDWNNFLLLSKRHKVLPLIYGILNAKCKNLIPESIFIEIKQYCLINHAYSLKYTTLFLKIIDILEQNAIISVPLKGPAISEELYGDIGLRVFSDLDILVSEKNAYDAFEILISHNFVPELELSRKQFSAYMRSEDHIILMDLQYKIGIELHWELSGRFLSKPFTMKQIEGQLQQSVFYGKNTFQFSREVLLVYLCVHGSKHIWNSLEMIYLVATLLKKQIDWDKTLAFAKNMYSYKILFLGISLSRLFFDSRIPDNIQKMIDNEPKLMNIADYIKTILLENIENNNWAISKSKFTKYQFVVLDRLRDKLRYFFFVILFPTNYDWASITVSEKYSFVYYIIRPFRLIKGMFNYNK